MAERDELLTVAEVAEWLQLNPQTIRNYIGRGTLTAVRLGSRSVRVWRSEVERFTGARDADDEPPAVVTDAAATRTDVAAVASALRVLAAWIEQLADALDRPGS